MKTYLEEQIAGYKKQFKAIKRGDETIIVFDNECNALHNSVYEAHDGKLPDDWIYEIYHSILETLCDYSISDMEDIDNVRNEIVENTVDCSNYELTGWLHDHNGMDYLDTVLEEYEGTKLTGSDLLSHAQYSAIDGIYSCVENLLRKEEA